MSYNPGNMRPVGQSTGFQSFSTPQDGLAAMMRDLSLKVSGKSNAMAANYGANYTPTLRNLISTWAPPTENDTENYIGFVSGKSGIDPDAPLTVGDIQRFAPHMIEMEKGMKGAKQYADSGQIMNDASEGLPPLPEGATLDQTLPPLPDGATLDSATPSASPPDAIEDVAKTVGSKGLQGALSIPMVIPDLMNQMAAGPQLLGRGIAEGVDKLAGISPQPRGELWKPFFGSEDVMQMTGLDYQPKTTAGKIVEVPAQIGGSLLGAKGMQKINTSLNKAPIPSTDEIYDASNKAYANADANGGILKSQALEKGIDKAHAGAGFQSAEGKEFAGKNDVTDALSRLEAFRGRPMTLKGAQEIDESLSESIDAHFDKINGLDKQGAKLIKIQQALRDTYKNATPADVVGGHKSGFDSWKEGQQLWSAGRHADDIERILRKGASADVPATAYKNGFKALRDNADRMRGFSDAEKKAINHAAKTGLLTGALKTVGSKMMSGVAGGIGGGFGGGWPGAMVGAAAGEAAGFPMRAAANALQRSKGTAVLDLIGTRPNVQSSMGLYQSTPQYDPNLPGASIAAILSNLNQ